MRKEVLILISCIGLIVSSVVFAAPTSTTVQNLYITGIKPGSGTSTLSIDANGFVGTTTISGTGSATTTINVGNATATGPAFTFTTTTASGVFTYTNPSGSTIRLIIPSNLGFFSNDAGYLTAAIQTLQGLSASSISFTTSTGSGSYTITTSGGNNINFKIPSNLGFFTNDIGYATTTCANPTANIGLSVVNGSAGTCLRSDSAPALSQSIVPTWSGLHTFNGGITANSTTTNNSTTIMIGSVAVGTSTTNGALNISGSVNQAGGAVSQASTTVNGNATTTNLTISGIGTSNNNSLTVNSTGVVSTKNTSSTAYFIVENPTMAEDDAFYVFDVTSTVTKVYAVNKSTGDTATFNLIKSTNRNTATSSASQVFASYTAVTATTTPSCYATATTSQCGTGIFGTNASTTMNVGDVLRLTTTAASSSQFFVQVYFTPN